MPVKTIMDCLYEPEKKLETDAGYKLYGDKGGLKSYHYEEILKRLNEMDGKLRSVDGSEKFVEAGLLLRKLWRKHEKELMVHTRSLYGGTHEQDIKSKKMKVENFKFAKNEADEYGIYIDLVYDTYQKDWSKAYQLTFHGFFTHIDYLSNYKADEYFSYIHLNPVFRFVNPDKTLLPMFAKDKRHQFSEIIIKEVKALDSSGRLDEIYKLPLHSKAPLYDIMGGVFFKGKYPYSGNEQFGHDSDYWLGKGGSDDDGFSKRLSIETYAHMASCAVVNQPALKVLKDYLPNAYKMFLDILGIEVLCLEKQCVDRREERRESPSGELYFAERININLYLSSEDIDAMFQDPYPNSSKMSERVRDVVESYKKKGQNIYEKAKYKDLVKQMLDIHLDEKLADTNSEKIIGRELTYLKGGKSNEKEMYVGFYDEKRGTPTMGNEFVKILDKFKPKEVVHLHPTKNIKIDRDYLKWQTMFSPGDKCNMTEGQDWIGIEFYNEKEGDINFPYTIEIHYCSRDMFEDMLKAIYEDSVRHIIETKPEHKEKINKQMKNKDIKYVNDYIDKRAEFKEGIYKDLKGKFITLPSIELYSIKDFKKSDISKGYGFTFVSTKPKSSNGV